MTHTLIIDGSVLPFVILPGLGCCGFPLTLVTGCSSTKRCPNRYPALQMYGSYIHCGEGIQFPHDNLSIAPPPTLLFFSEPVRLGALGALVSRGNQRLRAYAVSVVAPGRNTLNTLHSDTKASRPAELRVSGTGNKNLLSGERDYFLFKPLIHGPMDCDYERLLYIRF